MASSKRQAGIIKKSAIAVTKLRVGLRLNKSEFAHQMGVARQTEWQWEKGGIIPDWPSIRKMETLAKASNVPFNPEDIRSE